MYQLRYLGRELVARVQITLMYSNRIISQNKRVDMNAQLPEIIPTQGMT